MSQIISKPEGVNGLTAISATTTSPENAAQKWLEAAKQILPVYLAVHLAFFVISVLALLFTHGDFDPIRYPLNSLWQSWNRWDTAHFIHIAQFGYDNKLETAFFPFYPLLMKVVAHFTHHSELVAGLVVSNISLLVLSVVLYQLVSEDFDQACAHRTVLYLLVFPTAFFLAAAYSETLFLCFAVLSFYQMRRGKWWLAGLFGLLASLTRPNGLFLVIPFCFEYLYQHGFSLKRFRFDMVSIGLIPAGIALFALYCWHRFGDPLEFSVVQSVPGWDKHLAWPWVGIVLDLQLIQSRGTILDYVSLRNMLDLILDLFLLLPLLVALIGPWKFPGRLWSYVLLGLAFWLFFNLYVRIGSGADPLSSMSRYMVEVFPAFIFLAVLGKHRTVHACYVMISSSMLFFMLTQFLNGRWIL
jgi:hypothetical protein